MLSPNKSLYLPEGLGIVVDENDSSDFQQFNNYLDEALNSPSFENSQLGLLGDEQKQNSPISQRIAEISNSATEPTKPSSKLETICDQSSIGDNPPSTSPEEVKSQTADIYLNRLKTPPRYHPHIPQNNLVRFQVNNTSLNNQNIKDGLTPPRDHNFQVLSKSNVKNYSDQSFAKIQNTTPSRPTFKFQNEESKSIATNISGSSSVDESDDSSEYFQLNIANDTLNTISASEALNNNYTSPLTNNFGQDQHSLKAGSSGVTSNLHEAALESDSNHFGTTDEIEDLDKPVQFDGSYESYVNIKQVLTSINENNSPDRPNFSTNGTSTENNHNNPNNLNLPNNVNQLYDIEELEDEYNSTDDSFSNSDKVEILEIRRKNTVLKLPINYKEFKDYEGSQANPLPELNNQYLTATTDKTNSSITSKQDSSVSKNPMNIFKVSFDETFKDSVNSIDTMKRDVGNNSTTKTNSNQKLKPQNFIPYPTEDESFPDNEENFVSKIIPNHDNFEIKDNNNSKDIDKVSDSLANGPGNDISEPQILGYKTENDFLPYPTQDDSEAVSYDQFDLKLKHESTSTITTSTTLNSRSNSTKNTNSMGSIITNNKLQETIFSNEQFKVDGVSTPNNFEILNNKSETDVEDLETPKLANFTDKSFSSMEDSMGSKLKEKSDVTTDKFLQNNSQNVISKTTISTAPQQHIKKVNSSTVENFWSNDPWKYNQYNPNISEYGSTIHANPKYYDSALSMNGTLNFSKILAIDTSAANNTLLKDPTTALSRSSNVFEVDSPLSISAPKFIKNSDLVNHDGNSFISSSQTKDSNIALETQAFDVENSLKTDLEYQGKATEGDIHYEQHKPEQRNVFVQRQNQRFQQNGFQRANPTSTRLNIASHLPLSKQYMSNSMRSPNNVLSPNSLKSLRNIMSPNAPNYQHNVLSPNSLKSPNSSKSPNFLKSPILQSQIDEEMADMVLMNKNFFVTYNGERTNDLYKTMSKKSKHNKNSNIAGSGMSYQRYKSAINYSKNISASNSNKDETSVEEGTKSKDFDKRESTMSAATTNTINQKSIIDIYNNMQQQFPSNNTNIKNTTILENKEIEFESLVVSPKDISKIELGLEELSLFEKRKRMSEMTMTTVTHRNTLDSRDFVDPPSMANVLFNSTSTAGGSFNIIDKYFLLDSNSPILSGHNQILNVNFHNPATVSSGPELRNNNSMYHNNFEDEPNLPDEPKHLSNANQLNSLTEKESNMYKTKAIYPPNNTAPLTGNQSQPKKHQKPYITHPSSQFNNQNVQKEFSNSSSFSQHVTPRNLNNKSSRMTMQSRQVSLKSANTFASKYHPADISIAMPSIENSAYIAHLQNSNSIYTEETDDVSLFESVSIMSDGASTILEMNMNRGKSMRAVSYEDLPNADVGEMYRQLSFYENRDEYDY